MDWDDADATVSPALAENPNDFKDNARNPVIASGPRRAAITLASMISASSTGTASS